MADAEVDKTFSTIFHSEIGSQGDKRAGGGVGEKNDEFLWRPSHEATQPDGLLAGGGFAVEVQCKGPVRLGHTACAACRVSAACSHIPRQERAACTLFLSLR